MLYDMKQTNNENNLQNTLHNVWRKEHRSTVMSAVN